MRNLRYVFVIAIVVGMVSFAQAGSGDKIFRFGVSYVNPTGDYKGDVLLEADAAAGIELGMEFMFNDFAGFDASVGYSDHELTVQEFGPSGKLGEISQTPILFGVNFHLFRESNLDFYLGPTIGYVLWGNIDVDPGFEGGGTIQTSDAIAYGANFGLDVPFNDRWSFSAGLRYLASSVETDGSNDIEVDVDPFVVRAGLSVKF